MDLSRPVVVQRHSYCPFAPYGLAPGPKTCKMRQHLGQTLRNPYLWNHWVDLYHFEFYGIVVVQHHGHLTLTLDFQGQILKMLKKSKVKFWKFCISGMEGPIDMERKGCESIGCCYTHFVTFNVPLTHDLDLGFSRSNFEKVRNGMVDWHGIKGMWIDRMLDPCCDF